MPKTRVAVAVRPFPVPRSLAGKTSGEMAYRTPYIICTAEYVSWCKRLSCLEMLTLLAKAYLYRTNLLVRRLMELIAHSPAVPPEQSIRAAGGGTREEKDTSEPYLSRGVVE